jgi:hypothetical protein
MNGAELAELIVRDFGTYLYHGAPGGSHADSAARCASILAEGIRGSTVYRETPTVYLTTSPWVAADYAQLDRSDVPGPLFRVAVHSLDPALLRGDEWQLLPDRRYPAFSYDVECDCQRGTPLNGRFPADGFAEAADVIESLAKSSQLAYIGSLAVELLEAVDVNGFLLRAAQAA